MTERILDFDKLNRNLEREFSSRYPYPWINLENPIFDHAYKELYESLPSIELFKKTFGMERKYGQKSHDRFELFYEENLPLSDIWHKFISELKSKEYLDFVCDLFKINEKKINLRFQWQYSTKGCSVSPHCDGLQKVGSQIFYFNDVNWQENWGGQTLVLDDNGKYDFKSAPEFKDFEIIGTSSNIGNRSFIFARKNNGWHGVKPLNCPEGEIRKIFTTVIDKKTTFKDKVINKVKSLTI